MELIDNINTLLGENLKGTLKPGSKLKIAASCFSIVSVRPTHLPGPDAKGDGVHLI